MRENLRKASDTVLIIKAEKKKTRSTSNLSPLSSIPSLSSDSDLESVLSGLRRGEESASAFCGSTSSSSTVGSCWSKFRFRFVAFAEFSCNNNYNYYHNLCIMTDEDSNWFARWEEELPSPEELMPLSQTLITPDLALAFDIRNPNHHHHHHLQQQQQQQQQPQPPPPPPPSAAGQPPSQPTSAEFAADSGDLGSGAAGDEPARTLKRPRLVWTPQLHKRFVDAVAHLGIKNAVPKTIMQFMSVDGLTRENVASHLQKYRLYLKRMQGLSGGGGGGGGGANGGAGGASLSATADPVTDHLFASSPVPPHFLHPGRSNSEHFLPFVPVPALQHHHHHQQQQIVAAAVGHPHLQTPYHRQMGHFGSSPNGQFEHPFLGRQTQQPMHRMGGAPVHNQVPSSYVEDLESANGNGGRKVLTLFPTGDD